MGNSNRKAKPTDTWTRVSKDSEGGSSSIQDVCDGTYVVDDADDVAGGGADGADGVDDVADKRRDFLCELQRDFALTDEQLRSELLNSRVDIIFDYTGGVSSRTDPKYIDMMKRAKEIDLKG